MEPFFIRYRNILVLMVLLVAQIIGLAVQVRRTDTGHSTLDPNDGPGVQLIRYWANAVVTPPERFIHSSKLGMGSLWQNYLDLRHVREQNQDLQKSLDRLRLEQAELLEDARQGQRLKALLGFQQNYVYKTLPAQAIGSSGSNQSHVFYLDKGAAEGLSRDMAVITPDGIVGKVREVFPHSAQVLAINDQSSGAGVILETSRLRGILRGNAAGQVQIEGIMADQRIQPGEKVFTAGGDQIFPRGLAVGVVEKIVRDPERDAFVDVIVRPAANLERIDEVLVITSAQPHFSPEQQQDMSTSEALKGAEAAAIEEKKKASEVMAERLPGLTTPTAAPAVNPAQPGGAQPGSTQPGQNQAAPAVPVVPPVQRIMRAQHADRFSPIAKPETSPEATTEAKPKSTPPIGEKPFSKAAPKFTRPASPRRNP